MRYPWSKRGGGIHLDSKSQDEGVLQSLGTRERAYLNPSSSFQNQRRKYSSPTPDTHTYDPYNTTCTQATHGTQHKCKTSGDNMHPYSMPLTDTPCVRSLSHTTAIYSLLSVTVPRGACEASPLTAHQHSMSTGDETPLAPPPLAAPSISCPAHTAKSVHCKAGLPHCPRNFQMVCSSFRW